MIQCDEHVFQLGVSSTIYIPLFWRLNPPKQGLFQAKQGSLRFKVDIRSWSSSKAFFHPPRWAPSEPKTSRVSHGAPKYMAEHAWVTGMIFHPTSKGPHVTGGGTPAL